MLHCEDLSIHFSEINIQNIRVVYPKAVILYGGFPLKKAVTRITAVKVLPYVYKNLTFILTKNRHLNVQKTLRFKANENGGRERFVIDDHPKREKNREKKT